MESIGIIAKCLQCASENYVSIARDGGGEFRCTRCNSVLLEFRTAKGYIYILSNPRMPGLVKIGLSTRDVQERIEELTSATGVPVPFELEAYFESAAPEEHEQQIHKALSSRRIKSREFFEVSILEALQVAESVCKTTPMRQDRPNSNLQESKPYDSNYEYMKRQRGR
jgi:phage FluMu protein Com